MDADPLIVATRLAVYAALLPAFGLAMFGVPSAGRDGCDAASPLALPGLLAALAAAGLVASVGQIVAMAAAMSGVAVADLDRQTLVDLLIGSAVGYAWLLRVTMLVLLGLVVIVLRRHRIVMAGLAMLSSGTAAATLAWTGHGAMDEGARGWVHLGADVLHLLAAGGWLGALAALILLLRASVTGDPSGLATAHRALDRFSGAGTLFVGLILVTGIVNTWLIVGPGHVADLPGSPYGQLLLAKLTLFVAMLGLAAANRFRLVPALAAAMAAGDHQRALGSMRRSLALEIGCAIVILILVAWLGTLEPPS